MGSGNISFPSCVLVGAPSKIHVLVIGSRVVTASIVESNHPFGGPGVSFKVGFPPPSLDGWEWTQL